MKSITCLFSISIVTILLTSPSKATESLYQNAIAPSSSAQTTPPSSSRAGWRVYNDPITKELRAEFVTAEEAAYFHLDVLPAPDYSRMRTEILPDGSRILHTKGEMHMATVGYFDAHGNAQEACFTTADLQQKTTSSQREKTP